LSSPTHLAPGWAPARSRRHLALGAFLIALLPTLAAIWATPWFVTQDGPAHLYNAHVLERSGDPQSPFRDFYRVRRDPLPNWAGHLTLMALLRVMPPRAADRCMTSLTLAAFAASIVWLRWRVVGWRGMPTAALLAVLLALNVPWLLGFTSFLLGACLFPITLGFWWHARDRPRPAHVLVLCVLVVLGYFSHLVSLGLTVVGLAVLAVFAPGERRIARAGWTALGLLPIVPLGALYLRLTRRAGPLEPEWGNLADPTSLGSWGRQLVWADPLSLARKVVLPFHEGSSIAFALLAPVSWFLVALTLEGIAMARRRWSSPSPSDPPSASWPARGGWGVLAALLILGGLAGPDTFGESHGNYLPQRIVLLGLVALVPWLDLEAKGWAGRASAAALACAIAVQSAFLWEYATTTSRDVGALVRAGRAVGERQRVATLLSGIRGRFRANPLMHADSLLGVGTGNILWSNYETRHYYFPVQFREGVERPGAAMLELIALMEDPADAKARAALWLGLLRAHHRSIDAIVAWGSDPGLDRISDRWFAPVYEDGRVRVLRHR
jgi:hypothetical protein